MLGVDFYFEENKVQLILSNIQGLELLHGMQLTLIPFLALHMVPSALPAVISDNS